MIYKAFLNRQEITGFPVKGKETSEIWGGNTLLWKKEQPQIPFSNSIGFGSPNPNKVYVTVHGNKIISYSHYISGMGSGKVKTAGYGNISNGILEYNLYVRSDSKPVLNESCVKSVLFSTMKEIQFEDIPVQLKKVEDNIYSLTGDYKTLLKFSGYDDSGKSIGKVFTQGAYENHVYFAMYGYTIDDAINYLKK